MEHIKDEVLQEILNEEMNADFNDIIVGVELYFSEDTEQNLYEIHMETYTLEDEIFAHSLEFPFIPKGEEYTELYGMLEERIHKDVRLSELIDEKRILEADITRLEYEMEELW